MKKLIVSGLVLVFAVTMATAGMYVTWQASWGVFTHSWAGDLDDWESGVAIWDDPSTTSVLWALVFSSSDTYGYDQLSADIVGNISYGSGTVLAERLFTSASTFSVGTYEGGTSLLSASGDSFLFGADGAYQNWGWDQAGYVYQAVFQYTVGGEIYAYISEAGYAVDLTKNPGPPASSPDVIFLESGIGLDLAHGVVPSYELTAIPEPTTMALLGLGGLVMAIRRRRA